MALNIYYDKDADLSLIKSKTVAIWAMDLKDMRMLII